MINISAAGSQASLQRAAESVDKTSQQVSSGQRINSAADDAAGLAIAESFSSQRGGELQAIRNAGDGISLAQTASGAIENLVTGVQRIRELAVQSANGALTDQDRSLLQEEVRGFQEQISSSLGSAQFNGQPLFGGTEPQTFQVGPNEGETLDIALNDVAQQVEDAGITELSVASQEQASQSLDTADQVLDVFSGASAEIGAVQNQIESRIDTLSESALNNAAAESQIRDTDLAQTLSERSQNQIREEIATAVQAQANEKPQGVLQLISQV